MTNKIESEIKQKYITYIYDVTVKKLFVMIGLGVLILAYFLYSDIYIRHCIQDYYARLFPLGLGIFLFFFHLFTKENYKKLKSKLFNLFLISIVIMMYAICLLNLNNEVLASAVSGTILVIFLVSLELKTSTFNMVFIYFIPIIVFTIILFSVFELSKEHHIITNIYPMVILGFTINRFTAKQRYKLFKSKCLLKTEKQKTEELYKETQQMNSDLQTKNIEISNNENQIKAQLSEIKLIANEIKVSNNTKDKFFSILAHDLKSPFNVIINFSELLNNNFDNLDIQTQKKYISLIKESSKNTYKLLENLLLWSRSQQGMIKFIPGKIDLKVLLFETMFSILEQANNKDIQISNNVKENTIVFADNNMLSTVLRNLISNAIKFTPKAGIITINAEEITGDNNQKLMKISVKDTGIGISTEMQLKIFDITENTSTKGTEKEAGTGLGLIICREFIEKHDGKLWVESEPNKGSCFSFSIPFVT